MHLQSRKKVQAPPPIHHGVKTHTSFSEALPPSREGPRPCLRHRFHNSPRKKGNTPQRFSRNQNGQTGTVRTLYPGTHPRARRSRASQLQNQKLPLLVARTAPLTPSHGLHQPGRRVPYPSCPPLSVHLLDGKLSPEIAQVQPVLRVGLEVRHVPARAGNDDRPNRVMLMLMRRATRR